MEMFFMQLEIKVWSTKQKFYTQESSELLKLFLINNNYKPKLIQKSKRDNNNSTRKQVGITTGKLQLWVIFTGILPPHFHI